MRSSTSGTDVDNSVYMLEIDEPLEGVFSLLWILFCCGTVLLLNGEEKAVEEVNFHIADCIIDTHLEILPHLERAKGLCIKTMPVGDAIFEVFQNGNGGLDAGFGHVQVFRIRCWCSRCLR